MGKKRLVRFPLERYSVLVERLATWRDRHRPDLLLAIGTRYSEENDDVTMREILRLRRLVGTDTGRMHLGGLRLGTEEHYRRWFAERYRLGWRFANASFAGIFDTHDAWNRRPGDFTHLLMLQKVAAETGMNLGQYLFVARDTIPQLEALLDHLDALPVPAAERQLIVFGYLGWARREEAARIDEHDRDFIPERLRAFAEIDEWRSEREWARSNASDGAQTGRMAQLEVDDSTIDVLENMSSDDIVEDLFRRTEAAYRHLPEWEELCDRHGDLTGLRIYASRADIERKWLDKYVQSTGRTVPDLHLTHLTSQY